MPGLSTFDVGECCCPPPPPCLVTFCVEACTDTNIANAVVTVKSGDTVIAGGTTEEPDGCVTLDIGTAGTYTILVQNVSCFADYSTSRTMACGETVTISIPATCCGPIPLPATLYLTDANTTLTFTPATSTQSYAVSHSNVVGLTAVAPIQRDCANPGTHNIRITYQIICVYTSSFGAFEFRIARSWDMACFPRSYCADDGGFLGVDFESHADFNVSSPCPIAWSGSLTEGIPGTDPVGGTVTLSA